MAIPFEQSVLYRLMMVGRGIHARYFRRNEGTTDFATIPEITLTGDFEIEFELSSSSLDIL